MANRPVEGEDIAAEDFSALAASRGEMYRLVAGLFAQRPTLEWLKGLLDGDPEGMLSQVEAGDFCSPQMREALDTLRAFMEGTRAEPTEAALTRLLVDRTRLLGGIAPGYGPPPPCESVYREGRLMGETTKAVLACYREFDVGVPRDSHDPPDHIAFELDFMRLLCEKEVEAWTRRDRSNGLEVLLQEAAFLEDHILQWVPSFCEKVLRETRITDFYRGVAQLTRGFLLQAENEIEAYVSVARAMAGATSPGQLTRRRRYGLQF